MRIFFALIIMFSLQSLAQTTSEAISSDAVASEAAIPVHLENPKKAMAVESPWLRMLLGLGVVGVLGCGAVVLTRKAKSKLKSSGPAPEIKMLTQHHLGPKKSLAIIRVAGESILIGVTDQNISLIKSLSLLDEDVPTEVPTEFSATLAKSDDDFSISGIKDVISGRLKNLRTL